MDNTKQAEWTSEILTGENPHQNLFEVRKDHPFLHFDYAEDNFEYIFTISMNDNLMIDQQLLPEEVRSSILVSQMPDPTLLIGKVSQSFVKKYKDHLMGTAMNMAIKRVFSREQAGNIESIRLFHKPENVPDGQPQLNFRAVEAYFSFVFHGFPFLVPAYRISEDDSVAHLMIAARGEWSDRGDVLPKLKPEYIELDRERIQREFDDLKVQLGSSDDANAAIKAKLLGSISHVLYCMAFESEAPQDYFESNKDSIKTVKRPQSLKELLEKKVKKSRIQGIDGKPLAK